MINFTEEDRRIVRTIIREAISEGKLDMMIKMYNKEVHHNNVKNGFLDYTRNFFAIIDKMKIVFGDLEDFPFEIEEKELKLWKHEFLWTDYAHIVHGANLQQITNVISSLFTLDCMFASINNEINNGKTVSEYFEYLPLQEWLNTKIHAWNDNINNGDIIVFANGINAIYADGLIVDYAVVANILQGERLSVWGSEDFEANGENIITEKYNIVKVVDIKTRINKWIAI